MPAIARRANAGSGAFDEDASIVADLEAEHPDYPGGQAQVPRLLRCIGPYFRDTAIEQALAQGAYLWRGQSDKFGISH
jgi:hypothetical protein